MQQQDHNRFSCGQNRFDQIVLISEKIEVIPIPGMVRGPCFARRLLISAKHQDGDICLLRDLHRILNTLCVQDRIAKHDFVRIPIGKALGNLATQGIMNLGIRADLVFNSLKHAHSASRVLL